MAVLETEATPLLGAPAPAEHGQTHVFRTGVPIPRRSPGPGYKDTGGGGGLVRGFLDSSGVTSVRRLLPIVVWLPLYSPTKLMGDAVAGTTVGLMVLPQALADASSESCRGPRHASPCRDGGNARARVAGAP